APQEPVSPRDDGASPALGEGMPLNPINPLPGPYRVPHYRATAKGVVTHKTFSGAYRGAGRPEAAFVLDRLLDRAARALGMDPAELRRRNIVRAGEMPYRSGLAYRDGEPISYDPPHYPAGVAPARLRGLAGRAAAPARDHAATWPRRVGLRRGHGDRSLRGRRGPDRSQRNRVSLRGRRLSGPGPRDHAGSDLRGRAGRRDRTGQRGRRRYQRDPSRDGNHRDPRARGGGAGRLAFLTRAGASPAAG